MDSQSNLLPVTLLATSLFQRKRKSPTNSYNSSNSSSSVSSPSIRGTPIAVPQVPITEIFPPVDLLVKKENVDDHQRPSLALPPYHLSTTINDSDSDKEPVTIQMPVNNNNNSHDSRGLKDHRNYREKSMFPDSRPPKETPRYNDRVGMSVPPPDSSYMNARRDDRIYSNSLYNNNNTKDVRPQRMDNSRAWEPRNRDWNERDRRSDNKGPDPFLQDQSRGGRSQYDAPQSPSAPQRRHDNPYDARESSRPPERGRFFEGGSNKRRNESSSPKPRKRTGSITEDVRSGIADVSLVRNRSPEPASPQSSTASDYSEYDRVQQERAAAAFNNRSKSVLSGAAIEANGGTDVDMSPRKPQYKLSESKRKSKRRRTAARETSGESSSSDSSSSESDSSSDESDAPRLTGASGLKLHGQIHDLMLEVIYLMILRMPA